MEGLSSAAAAIPRLVIAAPQGKSGKTTVSLGICAALAARGLRLQAFKKGPDYIDPSWLTAASRRACRSLDMFFLPDPQQLRDAFLQSARSADLSLIEGNHGLYDAPELDGLGSTASLARNLGAPVILVVNAARMSRSAAAMVHGYQTFEPDTPVAGVIFNQVAQSRHEAKLRQAVEHYCRIPVLGALPRTPELTLPDRHLGLVPYDEAAELHPAIEACRAAAEKYLDLPALLDIARAAAPLEPSRALEAPPPIASAKTARIGVIRDQAFSFYYPENLEALELAGAELVFINALQDAGLPQIDALYIGGGFPEIFMDQLSANSGLRRAIRQAAEDGLPVYAECGGLMYLSQRIRWGERSAEMAGVLPLEVEMSSRPQGHGYVEARCVAQNPFFASGSELRGHEFHHSRVIQPARGLPTAFELGRGSGLGAGTDGLVYKNVLACYTHLYAGGSPGWAPGLVRKALGMQPAEAVC